MAKVTISGLSAAAAFGAGVVAGTGNISSRFGQADLVVDDATGVAAAVKIIGKALLPDFTWDCDPDPPKLTPPLDCEFDEGDVIEMLNFSIGIVDLTRMNYKLKGYRGSEWFGGACLGVGVSKLSWHVENMRTK